VLPDLQARSGKRVSSDPEFAELKTTIERFEKMRAEKSVSLNEAARQKEKDELKARNEALKKERIARATPPSPAYEVTLKNYNKPGLADLVKPKPLPADDEADPDSDPQIDPDSGAPEDDIILKEAQKILIDYSQVLKS
jgi:hypothetical protein